MPEVVRVLAYPGTNMQVWENLKVKLCTCAAGKGLLMYFRILPNSEECLHQAMKAQGDRFAFLLTINP